MLSTMERGFQDVRGALRMLAKSPGFTLVAIATLALGIGANTAIFTVANALLLRPLPYAHPERLTLVATTDTASGISLSGFSFPRFQFLVEHARAFAGLAAFTEESFDYAERGEAEQLRAARVSWNFFDVLGVRPALGRAFSPQEDKPGGPAVVVLGDNLWRRRFGGSGGILGHSITLDSRPYTVVGVAPAGFQFSLVGAEVDIWTPKVFELNIATPQQVYGGSMYLEAVGRLAPGVSIGQARAEMAGLSQEYLRAHAGLADANPKLQMAVDDLREQLVGDVRPAILILFGAVGLVLLIACANVAGLLLSRALGRRKEFAIRTALGASRGAIVRQLLTESVLLAVVAGAVGVLLSAWATRALLPLAQENLPRGAEVHIDFAVLAFSLGVAALTGVLFGLLPSLQASRLDLNARLRDEGRGSTSGRAKNRLRAALVVAQVALSMVLLIGAGLLIRSFAAILNAGIGVDARNVLTMQITVPPAKYPSPPLLAMGKAVNDSRMVQFFEQAAKQAESIPGVRSATLASALPLNPSRFAPMLFEGQAPVEMARRPHVVIQTIGPDYFSTMRTPLLRGRTFTEHDDAESNRVGIVNETLARRIWPGETPLGKHAYLGSKNIAIEVVGVAADIKNVTLAGGTQPELYLPYPQLPTRNMYIAMRTAGDPHAAIADARRAIASLDAEQPVTEVRTLEEVLAGSRAGPRFIMLLLSIFSGTALILAIVGLYGTISYAVAQRTQELGIRMALGADRGAILGLVMRQGAMLAGLGIAAGVGASLALTRVMSSLLFHVSATDPRTFAGSALAFAAIALAASYVPARRATLVDPTEALR